MTPTRISSKRDWTVMIYQGNGCYGKFDTHQIDLLELQKLPQSDRVTFLTQGHECYKENTLVRREIKPLEGWWNFTPPTETVKGRQNEAKQLADFVKWGMKNYPSERTCLVISGYAGGPNGMIADKKDGLMPLVDIRRGLEKGLDGKELDVLAFDGHWMACIEAASEFDGVTDLMVASQGRMESWDYTERFSGLLDEPEADSDTLASQLVKADRGQSGMSVLWVDEAPNANYWLNALMETCEQHGIVEGALDKAESVYHFKDLHSLVDQFTRRGVPENVRAIAMETEEALSDLTLEQGALKEEKLGGINVGICYGGREEGRAFRRATGWDDFLKSA